MEIEEDLEGLTLDERLAVRLRRIFDQYEADRAAERRAEQARRRASN